MGAVGELGGARRWGLERSWRIRPRLLKVIRHWTRKTNSHHVLPGTRGPSLRPCSCLQKSAALGSIETRGGPHSTSIKQMSWLPGHSVTLFLGKLEQAKRAAPLFRAAFLHYTVFTRQEPSTNKTGRQRTTLTSPGLPVRVSKHWTVVLLGLLYKFTQCCSLQ